MNGDTTPRRSSRSPSQNLLQPPMSTPEAQRSLASPPVQAQMITPAFQQQRPRVAAPSTPVYQHHQQQHQHQHHQQHQQQRTPAPMSTPMMQYQVSPSAMSSTPHTHEQGAQAPHSIGISPINDRSSFATPRNGVPPASFLPSQMQMAPSTAAVSTGALLTPAIGRQPGVAGRLNHILYIRTDIRTVVCVCVVCVMLCPRE